MPHECTATISNVVEQVWIKDKQDDFFGTLSPLIKSGELRIGFCNAFLINVVFMIIMLHE